MKSASVLVSLFVAGSLLVSGCGGSSQQQNTETNTPSTPAQASAPAAGSAAGTVDITFRSEPDPPRAGENTFDVMVMSGGQPVTDADVSVEFFMAAMPSMKMPEMRHSVALQYEGGGRYRGTGNVVMAGGWDATVSVKRAGQELGSRTFPVTAVK